MPDWDGITKVPQKVDVATTPQNLLFKGVRGFEVRIWVCQDCGFIEQYLQKPQAFARAYREFESNR